MRGLWGHDVKAGAVLLLSIPVLLNLIFARATSGNTDLQSMEASSTANYRHWVEAIKRKDVAAVLTIYTDDAIVLPPGQEPVIGREAIREFYKSYYAGSWQLVSEEFKTTSIVLRGDVAIETADYSGEINQGEKGTIHFKGKNLVVWKRQKDGSWKLFRDMWSSSGSQ